MKPLLAAAVAAAASVPSHAGPTERVILAAMQLSDESNYSWSTTVTDDARRYMIEGKTRNDGCTWLRLPMMKVVAERLGREADVDFEAFFRAKAAPVIRTDRGWKTLKELPRYGDNDAAPPWSAQPRATGMRRSSPFGAIDPFGLPPMPVPRTPYPYDDDDDDRPYSNAQFAVSRPHEDLSVIVSSFADMKVEGDTVAGVLTSLGAELLLVHDGQDKIKPLGAAGSFRLFLNAGRVVKYDLALEGILLVAGKRVQVHQRSSTEVKAVGATVFDVPEEARRKLGL